MKLIESILIILVFFVLVTALSGALRYTVDKVFTDEPCGEVFK